MGIGYEVMYTLTIEKANDELIKDFPIRWQICTEKGAIVGLGWCRTEKEAFKAASAYYASINK